MKIFAVIFAVVVTTAAASVSKNYIPPVTDNSLPSQEYVPPEESNEGSGKLADDGYRYKIVRKAKLRLRRDVSELPPSEYLQPILEDQEVSVDKPVSVEISIVESTPELKTESLEDGYRYKTVRRLKYRHRRDVSELPNTEYLPPADVEQPISEEVAAVESNPEVPTELAEDGYRYKTVRRLKLRQRRDVNELPASQYLPAVEDSQEKVSVGLPDLEKADDIGELPAYEYLPPKDLEQPISNKTVIDKSVPEVKTELAEDGYHYKTVRRLKYRHRRDVSELPDTEYLPPADVEQPISEEVAAVESNPEVPTELAEDGYRYKTVSRLILRQRRDVNELPASQYLPAVEESHEKVSVDISELPANEYLPPINLEQPNSDKAVIDESVPEVKAELAEDGYRYKTVRRLKYRHRRDVSELPDTECLPPADVEHPVFDEVAAVESNPEVPTELAEDGYRYKTVRRLKLRQRRDVNEFPTSQYLPAVEESQEKVSVDISELPANEYLPPFDMEQPNSDKGVIDESVPEVKTELAEDGYRYKTIRRLKYRHRRDISELPAIEYLPSTDIVHEEFAFAQPVLEKFLPRSSNPETKSELANDGYRYKAVHKLKYSRH